MSSVLSLFCTSDDGLRNLVQQNGLWQQQRQLCLEHLLTPAAAMQLEQLLTLAAASSFLLMLRELTKNTCYCAHT
jgi:hypothetical protein